MADLSEIQSSQSVKIAGANPSTGIEDNYLDIDSQGRITNTPNDGNKSTYSATALGLAVANTPTDVFTISGSATKTIRIIRISVTATQNSSAVRDVLLIKRSALNTGGTSSSVTKVPHDSTNPAAAATILSYTANPTALGAAIGTIRAEKIDVEATNLVGSSDRLIWEFGNRPAQAVVLRGTSELLAINLNSVTSSSNSWDISMEFTEE